MAAVTLHTSFYHLNNTVDLRFGIIYLFLYLLWIAQVEDWCPCVRHLNTIAGSHTNASLLEFPACIFTYKALQHAIGGYGENVVLLSGVDVNLADELSNQYRQFIPVGRSYQSQMLSLLEHDIRSGRLNRHHVS